MSIDVDALRRAIYTVSRRHRLIEALVYNWANVVDSEDRTQEIADEYAREVGPPRLPSLASEYGRLLAERDRLIAIGVDPDDLEKLEAPD